MVKQHVHLCDVVGLTVCVTDACVCVFLMIDAVLLLLTALLPSALARLLTYIGLILDKVICCYSYYCILLSTVKPLLIWKFVLPWSEDAGICAQMFFFPFLSWLGGDCSSEPS